MKLKLILVTILAFGGLAHAQGIMSNLSIGAGFEGIFPSATFTKAQAETNAAANTQSTTNSVGYGGDLRYDFGHHSAIGLALTFNRDTELFYNGASANSEFGFLEHVQTNNIEMIGTYIFRLPSNSRVKPFALVGGGMVRFSPNNDYNVTGVPQASTKPAFAYGFGSDFALSSTSHWALRLQYRGLLRASPDFKLTSTTATDTFGTSLRSHVAEPSLQIVYHF